MSRRAFIYGGIVAGLILILVGMAVLTYRSVPLTLTGITQLESATNQLTSNPQEASTQYTEASNSLQQALTAIRDSGPITLVAPLPPFRWIVHLNKAVGYLAAAGNTASQAAADYPALPPGQNINSLLSSGSNGFFTWYAAHPQDFSSLEQNIAAADTELSAIPSWIFLGKRAEFEKLASDVHEANLALPKVRTLINAIHQATGSGDSGPHTFLIVFQNNTELRPTGGFIGSYATLTASSGVIRTFTFGTNIYDIDRPYAAATHLDPPAPLKTITDYWALRDSTVGTGFLADGAANIQKFYTAETGQPIDGVILLDTTVLQDVLAITGPIPLPDGSATITAANVNTALTTDIEQTYYQSDTNKVIDQPKSILNDLIPALISALEKAPNGLHALLPAIRNEVQRKSMQFWFPTRTTEQAFAAFTPVDAPTGQNWIKVVNTNIGGLKSSTNVRQTVQITQSESLSSTVLTQTIHITRQHTGTGVWPDGPNDNYMEVYLPATATVTSMPTGQGGQSQLPLSQQQTLGSSYSELAQPQVDSTSSWVRVGFWASTEAGQTTQYTLSYTLPLNAVTDTTFTYLKEAGAENETLHVFSYDGPVSENMTLRKE